MNATKRKFNALLQGIGTRSVHPVSTTDADGPSAVHDASDKSSNGTAAAGTAATAKRPSSNVLFTSPLSSTSLRTGTKTTPLSSAAAELEFLAKRRRMAGSPQGKTLRNTSGHALLSKTTTTVTTKSPQLPPPPAPRYCPGDREQLLRRLATFQELTDWTPKPDRINEIEWAKRGWVCQGKERVRCTLCSKEVVVRLGVDKKDSGGEAQEPLVPLPEAEAALVDSYAARLVDGHDEDCLWRKRGCDASLLRLSLAQHPRTALADLRRRYDELCGRRDFLPYEFNLRLPAGLDLDAVLAGLPPDFFTLPPPPDSLTLSSPPNRTALALAVTGWQGLTNHRIGAVPNSASCHACLRRLGLWMFKSKQVDLATRTVLEPAPMDGLDGVREHRFFCPWKNGAVQRNPGGSSGSGSNKSSSEKELPGWAVLVQLIQNEAYLRNRVAAPRATLLKKRHDSTASSRPGPDRPDHDDSAQQTAPTTPVRRPPTSAAATPSDLDAAAPVDEEDVEDDEAARSAKDKERWARLRRVKSLFDPKGAGKKLRRGGSRPGTATSTSTTKRPETGQSGV